MLRLAHPRRRHHQAFSIITRLRQHQVCLIATRRRSCQRRRPRGHQRHLSLLITMHRLAHPRRRHHQVFSISTRRRTSCRRSRLRKADRLRQVHQLPGWSIQLLLAQQVPGYTSIRVSKSSNILILTRIRQQWIYFNRDCRYLDHNDSSRLPRDCEPS